MFAPAVPGQACGLYSDSATAGSSWRSCIATKQDARAQHQVLDMIKTLLIEG
jgi:hypothetical protein